MYSFNVYRFNNHILLKFFFNKTKNLINFYYIFKFEIFFLYLYYGDSLLFYESVLDLKNNECFVDYFEMFSMSVGIYNYDSHFFTNTNYTFYYNKKNVQIWYKINKPIYLNSTFKWVLIMPIINNFWFSKKKSSLIMSTINNLLFSKKKNSFFIYYFDIFNSLNNFFKKHKQQFGEHSLYNYIIGNYIYGWNFFAPNPIIIIKKINNFYFYNINFFFYFYKFFKNFFIPFFTGFIFFYYSFFFFKLTFVKTLGNWLGLGLFLFWLFSTFNFFIKKYKYAKYTSAIQRFWKRAFMCFWMIEGFLFMIFFYYLLNATGEPYFMFDMFGLYINHLIVIKSFLFNSFLIVLIINLFIFLLINIKFTTFKKNLYLLLIITFLLLYILFVESYQFYYLLNFYIEYIWIFSEDDNIWELEYDIPRTRNKNHYITLIIVAKFWHYIFIFVSWIFFVIKLLELTRIRYAFLSMNFQNIILFYIMNWLCLYSWLKWLIRRFMDQTYYWFFTSFRPITINIILNDFTNYLYNVFSINFFLFKNFLQANFYYTFNSFLENNYIVYSFFKNFCINLFIF